MNAWEMGREKDKRKKKILLENWQDEKEASRLYLQISLQEEDPEKKKVYHRLSEIEAKHAKIWEDELNKLGVKPFFKPRLKSKLLSLFGKILGHKSLLDISEEAEGSAFNGYFKQVDTFKDKEINKILKNILLDEKSHSKILSELSGKDISPFHNKQLHKGGASIRDIIFGMNDGLLSIFSLIAGISGAAVSNAIVLLSGLAGAIAGAISMAAGAYVSTKAQKEVLERHLDMERKELEILPEIEEEELALVYQLKGIPADSAREIAKNIMSNKEVALDTMAREELGFSPTKMSSPFKAGFFSGISFVLGASLPIFPFIIFEGRLALYITGILSLGGFFIIGAGRTIITGKSPWISGLEMFLIGTGAAVITYMIGDLVGGAIID